MTFEQLARKPGERDHHRPKKWHGGILGRFRQSSAREIKTQLK
jgi:hypothetical protein